VHRSAPHLIRLVCSALSAALVLTLVGPTSPASATTASDEATFLTLMNQERTRAGLPAMVSDSKLAGTSRSWSSTMGSQDRLYHDPNLAAVAGSVEPAWRSVGENVGVGYSASSLHTAFMNSPGHRANVMSSKFNRVGIGVIYANGKTWVTARFIQGPAISGSTGLEPVRTVAPAVPIQEISHACPTLEPTPFVDVPGTTHAAGIACAFSWNIASGRTSNLFGTQADVTRGQMATFLANALQTAGIVLPSSPPDAFSDDSGSVHQANINKLAALGVVTGRTNGTFGPNDVVTRAAMATFLVRTYDEAPIANLPAGVDRFWDDDSSNHEANIDKVGQAGLAAGISSTRFNPSTPVTRGQMATFVSRTLDLLKDNGTTLR
jgi:hypothetical protein